MTHMRQMSESEGTTGDEKPTDSKCRRCKGGRVVRQTWESSCGGYEDAKYSCLDCGEIWWVDGIDS